MPQTSEEDDMKEIMEVFENFLIQLSIPKEELQNHLENFYSRKLEAVSLDGMRGGITEESNDSTHGDFTDETILSVIDGEEDLPEYEQTGEALNQGQLEIYFNSDDETEEKGFSVTVKRVPTNY